MQTVSILIVDDDQALADAMTVKFSKIDGFSSTVANDGEEAISALKNDKFDVVLLDLHMPKKNGIEVLKAINETKNTETPVYVITNLGSERYCEEAMENGAKKCFVKSRISLSEIVSIIENEVKQ